jgi:hypothetical protein
MVYFQTKNANMGKKFRALRFDNVLFIFWPVGIFNVHLGYFVTIWYILCLFGTIFSGFGIMHQEKSGNPAGVSL